MRTILFGTVYLPQITCVEDFSPYWTTDNWTGTRMVTDLRIMKAIGCSSVRFHLYPAIPGKFDFPGVAPDKFLPMMDLAVETAQDLGLHVHLDLLQEENEQGEEAIRSYVSRYRGRIDSYQIGNERWDLPSDPERVNWLQRVLELVHSLDPNATVSADILVPEWMRIRKEMPELYDQLDIGYLHYYPVTDYRGWNDVYLADLLDHICNPTGRESVTELARSLSPKDLKDFGDHDAKSESYDHPFYAGSWAWLDKEVWITEISSHGYWRWGSLVAEDKRASDWEKVVDAVAGSKNAVTRIYHHCFRNKMSWREFGRDQSGLVHYDGSPRPATWAYKKMATKYAPAHSPLRALACDIERVAVPDGGRTVDLKIKLTNKTSADLRGEVALEVPDKATAEEGGLAFSLQPKGSKTWKTRLDVTGLPWGSNHIFARVNIPQGLVYGWGVVSKRTRVRLDTSPTLDPELSPHVRCVQGIKAVQTFLDEYGDQCAIVTGRALGNDGEMGYRLKIVLEAMRCIEVPVRPSILASEVLNRPLIVVGSPEFNLISRVVEMKLPEDQHVCRANPGAGKGLINVVDAPFGDMSIDGRNSPQSEAVGYFFGACPAALYIAGSDDEGTKAAAYDLILRIWGSGKKYE